MIWVGRYYGVLINANTATWLARIMWRKQWRVRGWDKIVNHADSYDPSRGPYRSVGCQFGPVAFVIEIAQ